MQHSLDVDLEAVVGLYWLKRLPVRHRHHDRSMEHRRGGANRVPDHNSETSCRGRIMIDSREKSRHQGRPVRLFFKGVEPTLEVLMRSVTIIPGTTEFGYGTTPVTSTDTGKHLNRISDSTAHRLRKLDRGLAGLRAGPETRQPCYRMARDGPSGRQLPDHPQGGTSDHAHRTVLVASRPAATR